MKRILKIIVYIALIALFLWIYFLSGLDQILLNLILMNIIVYIIRSLSIDLTQAAIKNLFVRYITMIVINIIWLGFVFWLIFYISPIYFVAIISFLVVAISLTFQNIINNIAAGFMLLSAEGFEAGDLIETNGVKGIVKEITLNHIKIEDFDGSVTYIPNKNAFNASITRFTHIPPKKTEKIDIKTTIKKVGKIIAGKEKLTRFIKVVELLGTVDATKLGEKLDPVFEKYKEVFGIKPFFYANNIVIDRLSITLQVLTEEPKLILRFIDPFLRDVLYAIYKEDINYELNTKVKEAGI